IQPGPDSLLAKVHYAIGAANNGWNQWVLNYNPARQHDLIERLQDTLLRWQALAAAAIAVLLLLGARKLSQRRRVDPVDALYSALCQRLGQLGLPRAPDEGPTAYAARLAEHSATRADVAPEAAGAAGEFLRRYSAYRYGPQGAAALVPTLVPTLKDLLSRVR